MTENIQTPSRRLLKAAAVLCALIPLTIGAALARNSSDQTTAIQQPAPPPHGFLTTGTLNSFLCGKSSVFFSNVSNQINALTTVPTDGSCGIAGVQWVGLKGMQLQRISFDVFGGGCTDDATFGVFMFLIEPNQTVPTACESFVQIPLSNGFTRYVIQPSSPTRINSIVIAHVGSVGGNANHVIGNFLINGNQSPFIQLNNVHPCPQHLINCNP
jgi:hypothetical protein